MATNVFINQEGSATFTCPKCDRSWTKNLSGFKNIENLTFLKCNCPCGNSFTVRLEKRRHFRKITDLGGAFIHDKKKFRGLINIKNISVSGIGFELTSDYHVHQGDRLELRFNIADGKNSFICKEAIVRKIRGNYVGAEFGAIIREHDKLHPYIDTG